MGKYNKQTMLFKEISGKRIKSDFGGSEITSNAYLLFIRETEKN